MSEQEERQLRPEVFKKWFKIPGRQGFLSIKDWLDEPGREAGRFIVDIGEQKDGEQMQASQTFISADDMIVVLDRLYTGRLKPGDDITLYGGGRLDGNPISRIFKVEHWTDRNNKVVEGAFSFKNGIFAAQETNSGAFQPIMNQPLQVNLIKLDMNDLAKMRVRCNLALTRFAVRSKEDPFAIMDGKNRD